MNEMCAFIGRMHEFLLALKKAGFSDELIQEIINSKDNEMAIKMFAAVYVHPKLMLVSYNIVANFTVDYTRTVQTMVQAGVYDITNSSVNCSNYPIPKNKVDRIEEINAKIFQFNYLILTAGVVQEMYKDGYRPATAHETMAFGAKNPEVQRKISVLALGSCWQDRFEICFLILDEKGFDRRINVIANRPNGWGLSFGFLGVKIK